VKTSAAPGVPRGVWQAGGMTSAPRVRRPFTADSPRSTWSFERGPALDRLARGTFDVLVIGGGMTGTGVALDAASRGSGWHSSRRTTSRRARRPIVEMAHGGLRYLQQREFRLVYENLAERQRLLDNAPHLITPSLPDPAVRPRRRGVEDRRALLLLALWLYDLTGGYRIGKRHRASGDTRRSSTSVPAHGPPRRRLPLLRRAWRRRAGGAHPGAHCRAVVRRVAANYAPVDGFLHDEAVGSSAPEWRRGGWATNRSDPIDVRANVVVNATGVWADEVRSLDEGDEPARSGQPKVSTSRCRGRASTVTSPR